MHVVTLKFILVLLAAVAFFAAAVRIQSPPRVDLIALGLLLLAVSMLVPM